MKTNTLSHSLAALPVKLIDIGLIEASKLNPRKLFADEKLRALGESMKSQGQMEAVLVRPHPVEAGRFELANGERRWRAAQIVGLPQLAAKVREMDDAMMLETALAIGMGDNVESLSALEEAAGLAELMKLRDWSEAQAAEHIGRSVAHVSRRVALLNLPPKAASALTDGRLAPRTAYFIATIPGKETRTKAAAEIMDSEIHGGVMPEAAALTYIRETVCRPLRSTPFDQKAADLLPEAGACTGCQWRAGNNPDVYGDIYDSKQRGGMDKCMNPACFERKVEAHRLRVLERVAVDGRVALSKEENARVFSPEEKGVHFASEFVAYNERPSPELLKKEVAPSSVPTWREMTEGAGLTVYVGVHQDGHAVELVKRDEALAAADLGERKVFNEAEVRRGTVTKPDRSAAEASRAEQEREDKTARAKAEKAQRKKDTAGAKLLREIADAMLPPNRNPFEGLVLWSLLYDLAAERLTQEEIAFVVRAWDEDEDAGDRTRARLDRLGGEMVPRELAALVVMMNLAPRLRAEGADGELANEWWSSLCAPAADDVAGEEQAVEDIEKSYEAPEPESAHGAHGTDRFAEGQEVEWLAGKAAGYVGRWYPPAVAEKRTGDSCAELAHAQSAVVTLAGDGREYLCFVTTERLRAVESPAVEPVVLSAQEAGGLEPVVYQQTEEEKSAEADCNAIELGLRVAELYHAGRTRQEIADECEISLGAASKLIKTLVASLKAAREKRDAEAVAEPVRMPATVEEAIIAEAVANEQTDFAPDQTERFARWFYELHVTIEDGATRLRTQLEHLSGLGVIPLVDREPQAEVLRFVEWLTTGPRRNLPGTTHSAGDIHDTILSRQGDKRAEPKAKKSRKGGAK